MRKSAIYVDARELTVEMGVFNYKRPFKVKKGTLRKYIILLKKITV